MYIGKDAESYTITSLGQDPGPYSWKENADFREESQMSAPCHLIATLRSDAVRLIVSVNLTRFGVAQEAHLWVRLWE